MAFSYEIPEIPLLLTIASFLFLLNVAEEISRILLEAGLIGSIVVGIAYGPEAGNIIPVGPLETFLVLGYTGLLLIVFEAGLTTDMSMLYNNVFLSTTAAAVGIGAPMGLSMLLLCVSFKYSALQGFAAGASLSSTSLGTTISLLSAEMKQTRTGVVILSAALIDDIVGLIIASVITEISDGSIGWQSIIQPLLVSFAFMLATYIAAVLLKRVPGLHHVGKRALLIVVVVLLCGYVAGAKYAGTSELLGAYLAGTLLSHLFPGIAPESSSKTSEEQLAIKNEIKSTPVSVFMEYFSPTLSVVLSPIFFASIGAALPMGSLGSVNGSQQVTWRGIVYSILMFLAKALVGLIFFVWPDPERSRGWFGRRREPDQVAPSMTITHSAVLLGLAMVARGEIALIVAQLGRRLLEDPNPEAYAVVTWAILLNTIGGALGVGMLLRRKKKHTQHLIRTTACITT